MSFPRRQIIVAVLLGVMVTVSGCSTFWGGASNQDRAIAAAIAQKRLVEAVMVEVIKLSIVGRISPAEYEDAKDAYTDWYAGQEALAKTMAAWRTVASTENDSKLSTALNEVADLAGAFLKFAGRFIDIEALQERIGASLTLSDASGPAASLMTLEAKAQRAVAWEVR